MSAVEYVISSLVWSLIGFAVGWLIASMRTDVKTIREAVVHDDERQERERRIDTHRLSRWLGLVAMLLAVATVVQGVAQQRRLNDISECQTEYNNDFAQSVQQRSALGDEDRNALQEMLLALYRQRDDSTEERLRTFEEWVATTQRNERERAEHPLPELPKGDCR